MCFALIRNKKRADPSAIHKRLLRIDLFNTLFLWLYAFIVLKSLYAWKNVSIFLLPKLIVILNKFQNSMYKFITIYIYLHIRI